MDYSRMKAYNGRAAHDKEIDMAIANGDGFISPKNDTGMNYLNLRTEINNRQLDRPEYTIPSAMNLGVNKEACSLSPANKDITIRALSGLGYDLYNACSLNHRINAERCDDLVAYLESVATALRTLSSKAEEINAKASIRATYDIETDRLKECLSAQLEYEQAHTEEDLARIEKAHRQEADSEAKDNQISALQDQVAKLTAGMEAMHNKLLKAEAK